MRMEKLIQSNLHLDVSVGVYLTSWLQQQKFFLFTILSLFPICLIFGWSGKPDDYIKFAWQRFCWGGATGVASPMSDKANTSWLQDGPVTGQG